MARSKARRTARSAARSRPRSVIAALATGTLVTAVCATPAVAQGNGGDNGRGNGHGRGHKGHHRSLGEPDYTPTPESLAKHKVPEWFEDAKLGIFITWGAYSVPAFAPKDGSGSKYAEWYWSEMNRKDSATQKYHLANYGKDVSYDDFLNQWKAEKWNPDDWMKLFKAGGAKYWTLVAKHHDGIALWDSAYTDRTTVKYGPHRDIVKDLVDADDKGGYGLKKGIYYSMPEWYNPSEPVQWGGWFGRGAPKNPFTGEPVPYTGDRPVKDYVMDYQYPQMTEVVKKYDPDVIWCDIGGVNNADRFMADYYNQAKNRVNPKEVAVDNRCGNKSYDFTTPEYSVEKDIKTAKWEASRGIGMSYGYNAQETAADYLTADQLVTSFVDIVSKNGKPAAGRRPEGGRDDPRPPGRPPQVARLLAGDQRRGGLRVAVLDAGGGQRIERPGAVRHAAERVLCDRAPMARKQPEPDRARTGEGRGRGPATRLRQAAGLDQGRARPSGGHDAAAVGCEGRVGVHVPDRRQGLRRVPGHAARGDTVGDVRPPG